MIQKVTFDSSMNELVCCLVDSKNKINDVDLQDENYERIFPLGADMGYACFYIMFKNFQHLPKNISDIRLEDKYRCLVGDLFRIRNRLFYKGVPLTEGFLNKYKKFVNLLSNIFHLTFFEKNLGEELNTLFREIYIVRDFLLEFCEEHQKFLGRSFFSTDELLQICDERSSYIINSPTDDQNVYVSLFEGENFVYAVSTIICRSIRKNDEIPPHNEDSYHLALSIAPKNIADALKGIKKFRRQIVRLASPFTQGDFQLYKKNIYLINAWIHISYGYDTAARIEEVYGRTDKAEVEDKIVENNKLLVDVVNTMKNVDHKIDLMREDLSNLCNDVSNYKKMFSSLLENKDEDSQSYEEIFATFQNQVISKIEDLIKENTNVKSFATYESELKEILCESNYNKLSQQSIDFIVTAKIMYDQIANKEGEYDFSGVCLLLTKALERECKDRFYYSYLDYMKENYNENISKYPVYYVEQIKNGPNKGKLQILNETSFTLGTMGFVTGFNYNSYTPDKKCNSILEFCKNKLFISDVNLSDELKKIGKKVNKVRTSYRNPAAHVNPMTRVSAEECFKYLISVEKLFQLMLGQFKY